mmetsp:Transcript_38827/g.90798  ORF Transcript_38827/g.90798 Transcript_38827/m.90798 type:complete len:231 (-) Transcript_38827:1956-2648(-)
MQTPPPIVVVPDNKQLWRSVSEPRVVEAHGEPLAARRRDDRAQVGHVSRLAVHLLFVPDGEPLPLGLVERVPFQVGACAGRRAERPGGPPAVLARAEVQQLAASACAHRSGARRVRRPVQTRQRLAFGARELVGLHPPPASAASDTVTLLGAATCFLGLRRWPLKRGLTPAPPRVEREQSAACRSERQRLRRVTAPLRRELLQPTSRASSSARHIRLEQKQRSGCFVWVR